MTYLIFAISYLLLFRAIILASGWANTKFFKSENFLFYQKILSVLFIVAASVSVYFGQSIMFYLSLANLAILGLFYLQPTPRITKKLAVVFIAVNFIMFFWHFNSI